MTDSTQKFDHRAQAYQQARPEYAPALLAWLQDRFCLGPGKVVADMGSGTGIFTRALLSTGATVYAVEPNREMRAIAEARLGAMPNFISVARAAEASSLPESYFDLITAAQAFHWFDRQRFSNEAARLLKPNAELALIWNIKDETTPFVKSYAELLKHYCPNFKGFAGGLGQDRHWANSFFSAPPVLVRFDHPLSTNLERFLTMVASSSYALEPEHPQHPAFNKALADLFARYAEEDTLTIPNHSIAFIGRPRDPYADRIIEVVAYDPAWPGEFEKIKAYLQPVFAAGAIAIEHVGSTAVPGLAAKPIIDIDLIIPCMANFEALQLALSKLGYQYDGNKGIPGREAFSYGGTTALMSHHLYACPQDSPELNRHLKFRDHLRAHPEACSAYAKIKQLAAAHHPHDIAAYLNEKGIFIKKIYAEIGLIDKA